MNNRKKDLIPKVKAMLIKHDDNEQAIYDELAKDPLKYQREEIKDIILNLINVIV